MLRSLGLFTLIACAIALTWYALGRPAAIPPSPLGPDGKLTCISYAPFHGDQAPYHWDLRIPDRQIAEDLRRLSPSPPVSVPIPPRARKGKSRGWRKPQGLKVLQGIWLGRNRADNRREIEAALKLARRHPETVQALIVGSETLLRGRARSRQGRGLSRRSQKALWPSGDLCRCLGVLAEVARTRRFRRLRHHTHPALLGGPSR